MVRPVATVKAMSLSPSRPNVSLVNEDISDDLFNKVPSKSKNIKSIQLVPSLSCKMTADQTIKGNIRLGRYIALLLVTYQ